MSDHTQCIPTPAGACRPSSSPPPSMSGSGSGSWEEQPVFRSLFLAHCPDEVPAAFEQVGRLIYSGLLDEGMDHTPERHLRGIADDLDACAAYLGSYLEDHKAPGIVHPAAEWRRTLLHLALDIRDRLGEGDAPEAQG